MDGRAFCATLETIQHSVLNALENNNLQVRSKQLVFSASDSSESDVLLLSKVRNLIIFTASHGL